MMTNGKGYEQQSRRNQVLIASLEAMLGRAQRGELVNAIMVAIGAGGVVEHACCVPDGDEIPRLVGELAIMGQALRTIVVNQRAEAAQREALRRPHIIGPG